MYLHSADVKYREKAGESIASKLADVNLDGEDDFTNSKSNNNASGRFAGFSGLQDESPAIEEAEEEDFGGLMVHIFSWNEFSKS